MSTELQLDKSDWKPVTLGDVVKEVRQSTKDPIADGIERVVGLEHLEPECIHLREWASIEGETTFTKTFRKGHVLFGRRRAYLKKAARAEFDGICSGDIIVMEAKDALIPELLPFLVCNDKFFDYAVQHSAGGLSPRTKFKDLANYEFLLPPKVVQPKLAELFWAADRAVVKNGTLSESARRFAETQIERNLTSPKLEGSLIDYCVPKGVKIGPFGSLLHKADYVEEGVPVIMPADIVDGRVQEDSVARISEEKAAELSSYRLCENDILFSRRGDLTKRALVQSHQNDWICGTGTIRVRLREDVNPSIVYFAMTSATTNRRLLDAAVGTTMPNINVGTVSNIPLHLPEGEAADKILSDVESAMECLAAVDSHVKATSNLLKSLINQIF